MSNVLRLGTMTRDEVAKTIQYNTHKFLGAYSNKESHQGANHVVFSSENSFLR